LLTDAIAPLDYAAYADALTDELSKLGDTNGKGVDLSPLVTAAQTLKARASALNAVMAHTNDAPTCAAIEAVLMKVSRHLVPVDYTSGNRFAQDPALSQSPYPVLDPLRRLQQADEKGADANFVKVAAIRARNRMAHALDEAVAVLDACLAAVSRRGIAKAL
jgi:hypothetical protein